ncbi:MAG: hypothetical protein JXB85_06925 [Anaerolineales bacterium]|nr:hypothetical protein [Anaerolineales bacterium]
MEFEQIIKRIDWLDEERRKDKITITALEERLAALDGELKQANKRIKVLDTASSQHTTTKGRIEELDGVLAQQRTDFAKTLQAFEKRQAEAQKEIDKRYQIQFSGIDKKLDELAKLKEAVAELLREDKGRIEEDVRRSRQLSEWETRMKEMVGTVDAAQRNIQTLDEARRQESKRVADLQGEINAARKRSDELREKTDLFNDSIRRLETRLNELIAGEAERRQIQTTFVETQTRTQVERDRAWKDWEVRFVALQKQAELIDTQLQSWDSAQRAVKRAQETYEEITQKFERRINEITEMQRLAEDRFRQEWVTFKSDDQKRWTGYTLAQEEARKDTLGNVGKIDERVTGLEDLTQTHQDVLQQTKEAMEQMLQAILAQIHELLSAYDRIMGSTK